MMAGTRDRLPGAKATSQRRFYLETLAHVAQRDAASGARTWYDCKLDELSVDECEALIDVMQSLLPPAAPLPQLDDLPEPDPAFLVAYDAVRAISPAAYHAVWPWEADVRWVSGQSGLPPVLAHLAATRWTCERARRWLAAGSPRPTRPALDTPEPLPPAVVGEFRTCGYRGADRAALEERVRTARGCLVDIRFHNRVSGEWGGDALADLFGGRYRHCPALGNRNHRERGAAIELDDPAAGLNLLERIAKTASGPTWLMCACERPDNCHRGLVGRWLAVLGHLVTEDPLPRVATAEVPGQIALPGLE